jgi:hypothetical protein
VCGLGPCRKAFGSRIEVLSLPPDPYAQLAETLTTIAESTADVILDTDIGDMA